MKWLASGALLISAVSVFFVGCSTKLPSNQELQVKNHIPQSFKNSLTIQNTNHQNTTTQNKIAPNKTTQNVADKSAKQATKKDNTLEQFMQLISDEKLSALLQIALERNTNVLTMVSRINQAKAQAKISTANMFPTINAGLNTNYTDRRTQSQSLAVRPGTNSVNASLSVSWELDLFGKLNALRQSSKKAYAQAQDNLAFAQISLIAEVGTLYFTLRNNAFSIAQAKEMLANLEEIDSINAQKYNDGLIDINTYKTAKTNLITQKNTLETLSYTYEQNKNALLVLLDINHGDLEKQIDFLDSGFELPLVNAFDINTLPSEVILNRPDVRASVNALYAQLYKITNAKAARLPSISLSGSVGQLLYSNMGGNSLVFQIANAITTPLLNRTALKQTYIIQQELGKEAYYTLQNTINTALSEIENALFNMDSQRRQVANNKIALDIGQSAYQTDEVRSQNGMLELSEFLTNKNSYLTLQTQLFTSKTNELISAITLFKAFGGEMYFFDDTHLESKEDETKNQNNKEAQ